jgi:phosphoenolpyruvate carboxylase
MDEDEEMTKSYLRALLTRIPALNFRLLHRILFVAREIAKNQEKSLMTEENLSTTLGLAITPYRGEISAKFRIGEFSENNSYSGGGCSGLGLGRDFRIRLGQ